MVESNGGEGGGWSREEKKCGSRLAAPPVGVRTVAYAQVYFTGGRVVVTGEGRR